MPDENYRGRVGFHILYYHWTYECSLPRGCKHPLLSHFCWYSLVDSVLIIAALNGFFHEILLVVFTFSLISFETCCGALLQLDHLCLLKKKKMTCIVELLLSFQLIKPVVFNIHGVILLFRYYTMFVNQVLCLVCFGATITLTNSADLWMRRHTQET